MEKRNMEYEIVALPPARLIRSMLVSPQTSIDDRTGKETQSWWAQLAMPKADTEKLKELYQILKPFGEAYHPDVQNKRQSYWGFADGDGDAYHDKPEYHGQFIYSVRTMYEPKLYDEQGRAPGDTLDVRMFQSGQWVMPIVSIRPKQSQFQRMTGVKYLLRAVRFCKWDEPIGDFQSINPETAIQKAMTEGEKYLSAAMRDARPPQAPEPKPSNSFMYRQPKPAHINKDDIPF